MQSIKMARPTVHYRELLNQRVDGNLHIHRQYSACVVLDAFVRRIPGHKIAAYVPSGTMGRHLTSVNL